MMQAARAGEFSFNLLRPPGHHATRNRSMGFCYLNSIAIAALAARDQGVDVIVLERDKRPWGSTSMSLGAVCGVRTREQIAHGIDDSVERFVADVMVKTCNQADPALTRLIGERSGPTLDWLALRHAVPLKLDFKWTGLGHSNPRLHIPPGRNGEELLALLANACARGS